MSPPGQSAATIAVATVSGASIAAKHGRHAESGLAGRISEARPPLAAPDV